MFKTKDQLLTEGIGVLDMPNFQFCRTLIDTEEYESSHVKDLKSHFLSQINSHLSCNKFIISSELFSGNLKTLYKNQKIIFGITKEALRGFEIEIIVFFRRQDEFIQSSYMQLIHQGENINIEKFLKQGFDNLDYVHFINRIIDYFGNINIHIYPYDYSVLGKMDIVSIFNKAIQSKTLSQIKSEHLNVGFSYEGRLIFENLKSKLNKEQLRLLRSVIQEIGNKGINKEYNILEPQKRKEILSSFEESNKQVALNYWKSNFGLMNFSSLDDASLTQEDDENNDVLKDRIILHLLKIIAAKGKLIEQDSSCFINLVKSLRLKIKSVVK